MLLSSSVTLIVVTAGRRCRGRAAARNLLGGPTRTARADRSDPSQQIVDLLEIVARNDVRRPACGPARGRLDEQLAHVDGQGGGDPDQDVETDVDLPALDLPDVFPGVAGAFGDALLAQLARHPHAAD